MEARYSACSRRKRSRSSPRISSWRSASRSWGWTGVLWFAYLPMRGSTCCTKPADLGLLPTEALPFLAPHLELALGEPELGMDRRALVRVPAHARQHVLHEAGRIVRRARDALERVAADA